MTAVLTEGNLQITISDAVSQRKFDDASHGLSHCMKAMAHPESVEPGKIRLFKEPQWILRMTIEGDRSYTRVKVVRAAPLTEPDRYFCILDIKNEAICMIKDLSDLPEESQALVYEELDNRLVEDTAFSGLNLLYPIYICLDL